MRQFCFRSDDPELQAAIEHEMVRQKCGKSAALLVIVQAGLEHLRQQRDLAAHHVYSVQQSVTEVQHDDEEVQHDQQA